VWKCSRKLPLLRFPRHRVRCPLVYLAYPSMPEPAQLREGEKLLSTNNLRLIVIGASAGGLNAIIQVVSRIDPSLPCSVLVAQHLDPHHESALPALLSLRTTMRVREARGGDLIDSGSVYTSVPGQHLVVKRNSLALSDAEPIHHQRPSIDLFFNSAAFAFGSRCIAIILSGMLTDGAEGLRTVKKAGGITIAEDPATAEFKGMPKAAVATGCVDYVVPLAEIGPLLNQLIQVDLGRD
jgi:two-component system chemotaxis response regulator CheB